MKAYRKQAGIKRSRQSKFAELVLVIGTSLEVYPVNQLPMMTRGKTAYINLDVAQHTTKFDLIIAGKIKGILQQLQERL